MKRIVTGILLLSALSGCTLFTPPQRPLPAGMPENYSLYSEKGESRGQWWKDFKSPSLNSLIEQALNENFSLREAQARMNQARYAAAKSGADLSPQVTGTLGASHAQNKVQGSSRTSTENWSVGLSASYELDVWGRLQATEQSSGLLAKASAEDLKAAMMTVSGQIAENWISLLSNQQQQELFKKQIQLQEQLLTLVTKRFPLAKSTALDIYQQQQTIEKSKAALIPLANKEGLLKRQLAFLAGRAVLGDDAPALQEFPQLDAIPALGLPADLIAARPDIRAAGLKLQAADWQVAAARADRLPALKLTASHTYSSEQLSSLFDNWLQNLAANLVGPLFDGSRRQAEVERTRAVAEERLATYGKTVFTAMKEVEDALADEMRFAASRNSLNRQLELSERTIREAQRRYLNGNSDFLNVLREELNNLQVQQDRITAEEEMIIARIRLYKALGCSWTDEYLN